MDLRLLLATLLISGTVAAGDARADEAPALDPRNTYGVIVGVLQWDDSSLQSYSKADRQDRALYQVLRRRGIPRSNLQLLLDQEATRENILTAIEKQAKLAGSEATLLFYYAGHGIRTSRGTYLANYDISVPSVSKTGLNVLQIAESLKKHFQGRRVLLMADCCHSGALGLVAEQLSEKGVRAACVTSVFPGGTSTNNWTYTQRVIDVFRGRPLADHNRDGRVSLDEFNVEVSDAMRHLESQRSGFANHGLAGRWQLAETKPREQTSASDRRGQYVMARDSAGWVRGRIVGTSRDTVRVQLQQYSHRPVLRVKESELRSLASSDDTPLAELDAPPPPAPELTPQTEILVDRDGRMHPATVLECRPGECRVKYHELKIDGEWIPSQRVTTLETKLEPYEILVEWGGKWWPAKVVKKDGRRSYVQYIGWSQQWNEWIGPMRMQEKDEG